MLNPLQKALKELYNKSDNGFITTTVAEELLQTLEINLINEYDRTNRGNAGTTKQIPQDQAIITGMDDYRSTKNAADVHS